MRVYLAEWCHCVYESGYDVISVHTTRRGAQAVVDARIAEETVRYEELDARSKEMMEFMSIPGTTPKFGPMFGKDARVRSIKVKK